ncbi:hypothetical protein [Psychromicrobium sp. YIM B11713]|uniref:hypothetical protein n=1 Tax=Psychromicrobium sp. YIM B11713 TaxID=3145233 RepID=UPI00374F6B3A
MTRTSQTAISSISGSDLGSAGSGGAGQSPEVAFEQARQEQGKLLAARVGSVASLLSPEGWV